MRERERKGEADTLIKEVSEPDQMGSLHVDDDRRLDQRRKRLKLHRVQDGVNIT